MSGALRHWVLLAVLVAWLAPGCVPAISTIGGHEAAEIRGWAEGARQRCVERTGHEPPYPFTTDGCTLWPDGAWQSCCVAHDMVYWCGGSAEERREADAQLRICVAPEGGEALAAIMYRAARLSGNPWLPFYWRWGYGWPWPRGYTHTDE